MRVLVVGNHHRIVGGAEAVALATCALLEQHGEVPIPFAVREAEAQASPWDRYFPAPAGVGHGSLRNAVETVRWPPARHALERLLADARPDVAHVHHVGERLTLSVLDALGAAGVPTVMTLHDYWPVCPNYRLYRDGAPCVECLHGGRTWRVAWHRCLEGSRWRSVAAAAGATWNAVRGTWRQVDRFVAPSAFLRDVVVAGGLPAELTTVVPNPVPTMPAPPPARVPQLPTFVYAGRLVPEKGLDVLLTAARLLTVDVRIRVLGSGPQASLLQRRIAEERLPVRLVGAVTPAAVAGELAAATATVLPARWFENCPMAVLEAAALRVPTIASRIGGVPELIEDRVTGLLVTPGDARELAAAITRLATHPVQARQMGATAWRRVSVRHDPQRYLSDLLRIYREVA